jgi:hypothetical protein
MIQTTRCRLIPIRSRPIRLTSRIESLGNMGFTLEDFERYIAEV